MTLPKRVFSTGFTLTELLIAIAVIGIVMSIALPSFQEMMLNARLINSANAMVSALQLARSEAIKRSKIVVVSPRDGVSWESGWIVFVDDNPTNDIWDGDINEPPLQYFDALKGIKATWTHFGNLEIAAYLPNGTTKNNGHFSLCLPDYPAMFRNVVIARTGRVKVQSPKDTQATCY